MRGFEPPTSSSRTKRASHCATPRNFARCCSKPVPDGPGVLAASTPQGEGERQPLYYTRSDANRKKPVRPRQTHSYFGQYRRSCEGRNLELGQIVGRVGANGHSPLRCRRHNGCRGRKLPAILNCYSCKTGLGFTLAARPESARLFGQHFVGNLRELLQVQDTIPLLV